MKKIIFLLLICSIYCSYSQTYKQYLIAYWSFDDSTAKDNSGHGYDGKIMHTPTPVMGVHGKGTAFHFIGRGDYVDYPKVPDGDHIILPRIPFESFNEFTVSMWVKDENMSYFYGDFYLYFGWHENGWLGVGNHTLQRYNGDTVLYSLFSIGADQSNIQPLNYLFDLQLRNKWVHYGFTYKNNIISGYVNGKFIGSKKETLRIEGTTGGMACHWWTYSGKRTSARFTGSLDEVKIFTKALSDTDIVIEYKQFKITARTTTLCEGDTLTLSADAGYLDYNWSTGEKSQNIIVNKSGTYSVTAQFQSVSYNADFEVNFFPKPKPTINIISQPCNGKSGKLCLNGNYRSYIWSTNETTSGISAPKSGKYSVTVVDSNGCTGYAEIVVDENSVGKINISLSGKSFCEGDTVELTADNDLIFYEWYESSSGQISGANLKSLKVSKSGKYYVKGITKDSCLAESDPVLVDMKSASDILTIEGLPKDGILSFDSTNYGIIVCKSLTIRNNSPQDYTLKDALLKFNINFSIPQSQFDFVIPANGTKDLTICSSPNSMGELFDTLFIPDVCSRHAIPMEIYGLANNYSGTSSCDFKLKFKTSDLPFKHGINTGKPYPNPVSGITHIPYEKYYKAGENFDESISINSIFSTINIKSTKEIQSSSIESGIIREAGQYLIDVENVNQGIYIIIVTDFQSTQTFPLMIQR